MSASDHGYRVRLADWHRDEAAIRRIREAVFVHEQQVPAALEWDGLDPQCVHALAETATGRVVGTGRLHPSGKVGRMAVEAGWRGRGVGATLLERLIEAALDRGIDELYLHAQVHVTGFYARYGFVPEGDPFDEAGIPHRLMRRRAAGGET